MRSILTVSAAIALTACGPAAPQAVTTGPRLQAALAADWPTDAPPRQAAFSADGRLLATSDASGLIALRETSSWRVVARLRNDGGATSLAFNGDRLFSGGYDGKVRIWDVPRRALVEVLSGPTKPIWTLDVDRDAARLAAGSEDGGIYVWNLAEKSPPKVLRGHQLNVWEVRFSPDGKQLASGSFDRTIRLWDATTGKSLRTLHGHRQAVVGLAYSPDGTLLASCGDDSTIRLWRADSGAAVRTIPAGNHTYKLAFSSDGKWLASGGRARGGFGSFWHQLTGGGGAASPVRIWRTADGALVTALPAGDDTPNVSFSPDRRWLVASGEDNHIRLWSIRPSAG